MIFKWWVGLFIFYINVFFLFYINWLVYVLVEIFVLFVIVLWKIFLIYISILFFFFGGGGGYDIIVNCNYFFYKEFLKWFNVLFLFLKIYYFLNKELLFVIKWRFEYLSFGMFVFNKYCIFLFVCKSKDIMFLSYLYILLKLVKFILFFFILIVNIFF